MGVRRAQHDGMDLARQVLVGGVTAGAAHQPQILAAAHRLADAGTIGDRVMGGVVHQRPYRQSGSTRSGESGSHSPCAGIMDSGFRAALGPEMT
jgi:hypothetical protein